MRPLVVFLGAPGVGKGTYASRVSRLFGFRHIVAGDLIRAEVAAGSAIGKRVAAATANGQLVDDNTVTALVGRALDNVLGDEGVILDGFPRTVQQAKLLQGGHASAGIPPTTVSTAIHLTLDDEICLLKLAGRRSDPRSGESYNISYVQTHELDMPPMLPQPCVRDGESVRCAHGIVIAPNTQVTCAACVDGLVARADDTPDAWRVRFSEHHAMAAPLLDHYHAAGLLAEFPIRGTTTVCMPGLVGLICQRLDIGVPQAA